MTDIEVSADRFGATMEQLLGDISRDLESGMEPAVRKAAQKGRREVRKGARAKFDGTGRYAQGWGYKVKKSEDGATAEIGNKDVPGLPHLLELGHAKVGGGKVPGREHIAPAADTTFDELQEQVKKVVDKL